MTKLYAEAEIRNKSSKRFSIELVGLIVGLGIMFGYLGLMAIYKVSVFDYLAITMGQGMAEAILFLSPLPCLVFLLGALTIAAHKSKSHSVNCPHCNQNLDRQIQRMLVTRSCSKCDQRVVAEGRVYSRIVYQRYKQRASMKFLSYWLWAWPVLSFTSLVLVRQFPAATARCSHCPSVFGFVGSVIAAWCFARTLKFRFLPSMAVSLFFFAIAAWDYWLRG